MSPSSSVWKVMRILWDFSFAAFLDDHDYVSLTSNSFTDMFLVRRYKRQRVMSVWIMCYGWLRNPDLQRKGYLHRLKLIAQLLLHILLHLRTFSSWRQTSFRLPPDPSFHCIPSASFRCSSQPCTGEQTHLRKDQPLKTSDVDVVIHCM